MESFEFLGGRYNQPEQIISGPMQSFRAQNAADGKSVFIHRVSTREAPEEQAELLKLLTTALVKSPEAKRLVLDFGEERGYWYVVTEAEHQCALLRDWLQLEIKASAAISGLAPANRKVVAAEPSNERATSDEPAADPGEFTRFLSRMPAPPASGHAAPGEFTSFFQSGEMRTVPAPVPPAAPEPAVETAAPGEFTRFFAGGLPPVPPKPAAPAAMPPLPPVANQPFVQRPNKTVSFAAAPKPVEPVKESAAPKVEEGEFTKVFSRPANAPPVTRPTPAAMPEVFSQKIDVPKAASPSVPPQGEFTQMFGSAGAAPPPTAAAPKLSSPLMDQLPVNQVPVSHVPAQDGPSEFTRIIQGPPKPPAVQLPKPPVVNVPKPEPLAAAAPVGAPANKKLIVLFSVLGVLVLLLILVALFLLKK